MLTKRNIDMYVFTPAIDFDDFVLAVVLGLFFVGMIASWFWVGSMLGEWTADREIKRWKDENKHED